MELVILAFLLLIGPLAVRYGADSRVTDTRDRREPDHAGLVVLDGTVTPELEAEGWAKDRIRELQDLRKSTGLDVSDRISVVISVPAERQDWARTHRDLIAGEILATSFEFGEAAGGSDIGDGVRVAIAKA